MLKIAYFPMKRQYLFNEHFKLQMQFLSYSGILKTFGIIMSEKMVFMTNPEDSVIINAASLGWGNKSLLKWSWSHDQDGRHAHIW